MTTDQHARAERFRRLHAGPGAFVIANPWDAGSARLLAGLGFEALATSSGAAAGMLGRRDGQVTRDEALAHARGDRRGDRAAGVGRPREGLRRRAADAAETIRLAAEVGLVGGSIEDASGDKDQPLYDFDHATERVAAAVAGGARAAVPFMLTARAENFLRGNPDLDDTIRRLQAFEKAGADVLFAPGLPDLAAVRAVCAALTKPVNFMAGIKGKSFSVAELEAAGVRRISLATSLYPRRDERARRRGARGARARHVRLSRRLDRNAAVERVAGLGGAEAVTPRGSSGSREGWRGDTARAASTAKRTVVARLSFPRQHVHVLADDAEHHLVGAAADRARGGRRGTAARRGCPRCSPCRPRTAGTHRGPRAAGGRPSAWPSTPSSVTSLPAT